MALAFRLLQIEGEHIYSGSQEDTFYRFAAGLGLFLLFLAFLIFTVGSGYLSKRLSALNATLLGCIILVAARVIWKILIPKAGMDNWKMLLVVPPLIGALSGFILILGGAIRLLLKLGRNPDS